MAIDAIWTDVPLVECVHAFRGIDHKEHESSRERSNERKLGP